MKVNSYVIWDTNGRYTYAWGTTPEEARSYYLANLERGISQVVPSSEYMDALPTHLYFPLCPGAIWPDGSESAPHTPVQFLISQEGK
jgi:hypothetical protein